MPASRHARSPRGGTPTKANKHLSTDKRQRQIAQREHEGRRKEALDAVRKEQAALDARMAAEQRDPAMGRVAGAVYSRKPQLPAQRKRFPLPPADAEGNGSWTMGQARSMLRQGYHVYRVQQVTGWGAKWFDDMDVDDDGFGLPL